MADDTVYTVSETDGTTHIKGVITTTVEQINKDFAVNVNLDGDFSGEAFLIATTEAVCIAARETDIPIEMFVMRILSRNIEYDGQRSE